MIETTAHITGTAIIITRTEIDGRKVTVATEPRPATFADADTFLAVHSLGRTGPWELADQGMVSAPVEKIDNRFDGTVAARIWDAVGTTHHEFEIMTAREVACSELDGWLITDSERTEPYVIAGSSLDGDVAKIHMVGEGKTWAERYTGHFMPDQFVWVARRKH
jgi:hypothetical protein